MTTRSDIKTQRLLIIDDEEDICEFIRDIAELSGLQSDYMTHLTELSMLSNIDQYDIVALDLSMPNIDGIEVIHFLEQFSKKPQLILMSGFEHTVLDGAKRLAQQLAIPVAGTLSKPFALQELQRLLQYPYANTLQINKPIRNLLSDQLFSFEDIEAGLASHAFIPYFQPQIDLATGALHGVEALVRWHYGCQIIMPDQFLPIIESQHLILPMTKSVIEQTLVQMMVWKAAGLPELQVSINLSAAYLDQLNLPQLMTGLLQKYPVNSSNITFEMTERISLENNQPTLDAITRLRLKGFYLSLDDFGTGYSSLAQLNQLPFNEIKIDKSFVMHALSSPISKVIVESSVALAKQLKVRCVAEGIENVTCEQLLKEIGCDIGQGYLYSRALPSAAFQQWATDYLATLNH